MVLQPPDAQPGQFLPGAYLGAGVVGPDHLQVNEFDPATGAYPAGPAYPQRPDAFTVDSNPNLEAEHAVMLNPAPGPSNSGFMARGLYDTQQQGASGSRSPSKGGTKGNDPMANDVSSTTGLVKAFGVSQKIAKDIKSGKDISSLYTSLYLCSISCVRPTDCRGRYGRYAKSRH